MDHEIRDFVERYAEEVHGLDSNLAQAEWELATTSSETAKQAAVELEIAYNGVFQRPEDWKSIQNYYQNRGSINDAQLSRQVERLYRAFARNQDDPERVKRIAHLSADIQADFSSYRAKVNGRDVTDNDILEILREETDSGVRRQAWEASKQIGPSVADRVVELAELRNVGARDLGYRDFYAKALDLQEVDEDELFALLDDLERQTRQPFENLKAKLDRHLSERLRVAVDELRPWHYADPFFQEAPPLSNVSLDPVFADKDVVDLSVRAFDRLGMDVRSVLERSDLYERPNKNQHAFCIHVDRLTDDVRILCNVRADERWASTMLHELGHAVYDKYLAPDLPYFLRYPAHTNSTEAIAMLMGRLTRNAKWLERVAGVPVDDARSLEGMLAEDLRLQMLTFVRWALVVVHFERALYANPRRPDLNRLWWELVSRFQLLAPPWGWESDERADWASKIHIALYPVYYHNYIIGELSASQIQHRLTSDVDGHAWFERPESGQYLRSQLFSLGARFPWNKTLERVTGEPLRTDYFARQFVATNG